MWYNNNNRKIIYIIDNNDDGDGQTTDVSPVTRRRAYLKIGRAKRVGDGQWRFTHGRSRIELKSLLARLSIYYIPVVRAKHIDHESRRRRKA